MITNALPVLIARIILGRLHVFTLYMWVVYIALFADMSHCGYQINWFPWNVPPFGVSVEYHDYHHSHNLGNYGSISMFWDVVCGTNKNYWKHIEKAPVKAN